MYRSTRPSRRTIALATAAAAIAALGVGPVSAAVAAPPAAGCDTRTNNTTAKLLECVRVEGVLEHSQALQAIADENGGNRASDTPGYEASVDYVVETLEAAGWNVDDRRVPVHLRRPVPLSRSPPSPPYNRAFTGTGPATSRQRDPGRRQPASATRQHQRLRGGRLRRLRLQRPGRHRAHPARHLPVLVEGHQRRRRPAPRPSSSSTRATRPTARGPRSTAARRPDRRSTSPSSARPSPPGALAAGRLDRARRRQLRRVTTAGQRHRRAGRHDRRQRRDGGRAPGLRPRRPRHQRQRQRLRRAARARAADGQAQAAEHRPPRLVGRGGGRASSARPSTSTG